MISVFHGGPILMFQRSLLPHLHGKLTPPRHLLILIVDVHLTLLDVYYKYWIVPMHQNMTNIRTEMSCLHKVQWGEKIYVDLGNSGFVVNTHKLNIPT